MNKGYKYRLYPTKEQEIMFAKTFGCCRKVYNLMLEDKIESYKTNKKFIAVTPAKYKKTYPYLKEVDSLALANAQLNLQRAFQNHYDTSRKVMAGFPNFKSAKRSRKSYTTNNQKGTVAIADNTIKLPKIGIVKAVIHRQPDPNWMLKSATVSQDRDGKYYVSVLFEYEKTIVPVPISDNALGLDYASDGLYVDDQGNVGTTHKYYRESHKKLAKAQRKFSRMLEHNICGYKKVGNKRFPIYKKPLKECKNIQKQRIAIARIYRHISSQRLDNLHKISTKIANRYDVVCTESLDMRAMSNKSFGNGKAVSDNGYGLFLNMLEYKLFDRGKHFIKVGKWFPSSQLCHYCGEKHPEMKNLAIRTMHCNCGTVINRDQNAAINIKNEGLRILQSETSAI